MQINIALDYICHDTYDVKNRLVVMGVLDSEVCGRSLINHVSRRNRVLHLNKAGMFSERKREPRQEITGNTALGLRGRRSGSVGTGLSRLRYIVCI